MIQAMLIILIVTLPVMLALRKLLAKRVQALMLRTSSKAEPASSAATEVKEIEAPVALRVTQLDNESASVLSDEARHAGAAQGRSLFLRWCVYDAIALIGALAVWHFAHWWHFQHVHWLDKFSLRWMGLVYLGLIAVRYFVYVRRYKDSAIRGTQRRSWIRRWVTVAPEFLARLFIDPRYSWYPVFFIVWVLYVTGREQDLLDSQRYFGFTLFVLSAILLVLLLRIRLDRLAQKGTNRRLLILRVFGRDENASLTFGALRNYWQHVGSTFTVVDPSFIRHKYRSDSETHIAFVFFTTLAWAFVMGTPEFNEWWGIAIVLSIVIIAAYAVVLVVLYLRAPNSFAASRQETHKRLERFLLRPRRWDLTFKGFDLYGFANTWKDAVAAFVAAADAIVMDLRGFSEKNKGCETEIDLLFDSKPIDQIVFLVNSDLDMQAVEKSLHERWEYLRADSPNFSIRQPTATIYKSNDEGGDDMKGLINLLYSSAMHNSRAKGGEARTEVAAEI